MRAASRALCDVFSILMASSRLLQKRAQGITHRPRPQRVGLQVQPPPPFSRCLAREGAPPLTPHGF